MNTKKTLPKGQSFTSANKKIELPKKPEVEKDKESDLKYATKKFTKKDFSNKMKTLVLSCADIDSLSDAEVPATVEILELGYNLFTSLDEIFERKLWNLKYLGLAYNLIKSISFAEKSLQRVFPNLMHLDLSNNELDNLSALVPLVKTIANLRILLLIGNPLTLVSGYRGYTLSNCQHMANLDEIAVYRKEMSMYSIWMLKGGKFEAISAAIKLVPKKQQASAKIGASYRIEYTWQMHEKRISTVAAEVLATSPTNCSLTGSRTDTEVEVSSHSTPPRPWADPIEFNDVFLIRAKNCRIFKRLISTPLAVSILDDSKGLRAEFHIPLNELVDQPEICVNWTNIPRPISQENIVDEEAMKYITIYDGNQGNYAQSNPITCKIVVAIYRQTYDL